VRLAHATDALWQLRYGFPQFLVQAADPAARRKIVEDQPRWRGEIDEAIDGYARGNRTEEERRVLAEWNEAFAKYMDARPRWFELVEAGQLEEAARWRAQTTTPLGAASVRTTTSPLARLADAARRIAGGDLVTSEQGRGFGVVAAEVRKLAERSQAAARQIQDQAAASVMVAERSGELLGQLVPVIQRTATLVQGVAVTSRDQSATVARVSSAMQQIDAVTQRTVSASAELASTAQNLAAQAAGLKELVDFFRAHEGADGPRAPARPAAPRALARA
jgi:methyl-accepting chemotaxis protein